MILFKHGRKPFLDFLRNLTVQGLILALALVAGRNLDSSCCDPSTWKQTLLFSFLMGIFFAAWGASSLQFFHEYLDPVGRHKRAYELMRAPRYKIRVLFAYTWKRNKSLFYESAVVFILLQMSLAVVMIHSVFIAAGFLDQMQK
jgi:hypothetical protein